MAKRKTSNPRRRRRTTSARRVSSRRRSSRRRSSRRRRKRNPALPIKDLGIGFVSGLAMAGADYGLRGVPQLQRPHVAAIEAGAGLLIGGLTATYLSKTAGVALAASGAALGGAHAAAHFLEAAPASQQTQALGRASGRTAYGPRAVAQMNAIRAPLDARAMLGAVRAPVGRGRVAQLGAVQAIMR